MLTVTFEVVDEQIVEDTYEKEFRNRPELYHYLHVENQHPWLSLRIVNVSGEEEELF